MKPKRNFCIFVVYTEDYNCCRYVCIWIQYLNVYYRIRKKHEIKMKTKTNTERGMHSATTKMKLNKKHYKIVYDFLCV